ncbi:Transcriptional regulator, MarR family [Marinobacterium lacunae]|uniref:Transcriptional regulator, MarR family n=1 Tax=Marinobacterium lacunae TaxID=1232683 RepID=A0A081FX57_9GAMM|nr:MarR family transcriptional regulator [Marinobacterium lacunae]KEA63112.1 Transcriptional regulator, MarR family [Marinobacterium lacunae]
MYTTNLFDELLVLWGQDFPNDDIIVVQAALRIRFLAELEQQALQDVLAEFHIGVGDSDVLLILSRHNTPSRIRPSDIAALCNVSTGAITGRLDRLQARGYIRRENSSEDKRASYVELTETGKALGLKVRQALNERSRFLLTLRNIPKADLVEFNRVLDGMITQLVDSSAGKR